MEKGNSNLAIPRSIQNWRLFESQSPSPYMSELYLYSDVHFIAQAEEIGPYAFLNALAVSGVHDDRRLRPGIALRYRHCIPNSRPNMETSNFAHYHGGSEFDEIAAIVSLELGCRIQAGPVVRDFEPDGDPLGRPRQVNFDRVPELQIPTRTPQIGRLGGQRDLRDLLDLTRITGLSDTDSVAFVKAARLYQQAIWVADSNPEFSWILLVSAIEAAAGQESTKSDKFADLEEFYPKVAQVLSSEKQRTVVASELSGLFGATRRFANFLVKYCPSPPELRPPFGRFDFSAENVRKTAKIVYRYRSKALHSGVQFPSPMCSPPDFIADNNAAEEVPTGLATYSKGATWMASDLPCHLHIFEYLVRGALLGWLRSRLPMPDKA